MKENYTYFLPVMLNITRYLLLAGIPFLVFYILFPGVFTKNKIQVGVAKKQDFIRELIHSFQTTLIFAGVGLLILKTPLQAYTRFYKDISDYPLWWIPVSVVLALIIHDTYFYWMHRTVHHPGLFKKVHLVHHKSVNPSPLAAYSFNFLEAVLEALVAPIILWLLPMHPLALMSFTFISFTVNVYGHLGYEIAPKWLKNSILFKIVTTSTYHNMHHAKFKGNYGLYFRFWDKLMATEHPDYEKEYHKIHNRRFGNPKTAKRPPKKSLATFISILMVVATIAATPSPRNIEGYWILEEKGAVIKIYKKDGLYFGQLIETDNEEDNRKIKAHGEILILKNFKKKNQSTYCCGTVFAPKKQKTVAATMLIEDPNTLRIEIKNGLFRGYKILKRS